MFLIPIPFTSSEVGDGGVPLWAAPAAGGRSLFGRRRSTTSIVVGAADFYHRRRRSTTIDDDDDDRPPPMTVDGDRRRANPRRSTTTTIDVGRGRSRALRKSSRLLFSQCRTPPSCSSSTSKFDSNSRSCTRRFRPAPARTVLHSRQRRISAVFAVRGFTLILCVTAAFL